MFKHYLIAAFRGIKTNKLYSFINIFGLAVGMASSVLIFLWIEHEVSFDRFFSKAERIYLANNRDTSGGEMTVWNNTSGPLAPALKKDYPEVEDAVRINEYGANFLLTANDKHFSLHGNFVDSGFLDLFDCGPPACFAEATMGICEGGTGAWRATCSKCSPGARCHAALQFTF